MRYFTYKQVITHSGSFTAEDVFSVALLRMINPAIKIVFAGPGEGDKCFRAAHDIFEEPIIYNIPVMPGSINSFEILWREFGLFVCKDYEKRKLIEETFINDIIKEESSLKKAVEKLNYKPGSNDTEVMAFHRAMNIAIILLKAQINA